MTPLPFPGAASLFCAAMTRANFFHVWPINAAFIAHSFRAPYWTSGAIITRGGPPMREFVRPAIVVLSVVCLAVSLAVLPAGNVLAQAKPDPAQQAMQPPALKQIALTDKQIEGVIAAAREMDAITEKLPENAKP